MRTILRRLASASERLERHTLCLVGFITIIYLAIVTALASEKLFWLDELLTFYISRLHSVGDVWRALLTGIDQQPPLFYMTTRGSTALFGSGGLAFRLPEILGFWLMSVSVFCFVRRRSSTAYGLVAMLFPLITGTFYYAYEARPYGLMVGFCGLALYCWQAATEGRLRVLYVTGLGLSLVGALSCHYFAIAAYGPLIAGETLRSVRSKRLDSGVWISFGVGLIPLAIFLPLTLPVMKAATRLPTNFWAKPHWLDAIRLYRYLLAPPMYFLVAVMIIVGIYLFGRSRNREDTTGPANPIPIHEIAAAVGFALFPIGVMILAKFITHAFTGRYALPAVIGVSAIFAWTLSRLMDCHPGWGLVVAAMIFATFVRHGLIIHRKLERDVNARTATYQFLQTNNEGHMPIVIQDPSVFIELSHYGADKGGSRMIYLTDVTLELNYSEINPVELGLPGLGKWMPLDVEDFHRFCASHSEFLIYSHPSEGSKWLIPQLRHEGRRLVVRAENGNQVLYLVTPKIGQ